MKEISSSNFILCGSYGQADEAIGFSDAERVATARRSPEHSLLMFGGYLYVDEAGEPKSNFMIY